MASKAFLLHSLQEPFDVSSIISKFDIFWKVKIFLLLFSLYLIFEGLFGIQIGILNPIITVIWIGWWIVIVLFYLPFNAKNWCSICPIPALGQIYNRYAPIQWLQSKKFNKKISLYGILPLLLFLLFSAVSVPVSTIPIITGLVLLALFLIATIIDIVYGERIFCKEVCPINPMLQTYNNIRSVSLQTVNFSICTTNHEKTCMIGDSNSYGCDWGFFPGKLKNNINNCTNCCDCIKACNYNNLSLVTKKTSLFPEEYENLSWIRSFLPLFFLSMVLLYSITKIATIEQFHRIILINTIPDIVVALIMESIFTLIIIPSVFSLLIVLPLYKFVQRPDLKILLIKKSTFSSIPMSLAFWIVFTIYLIIPNINLLLFWLADPFLLNWNIFNLKNVSVYSSFLKELFNYFSQIIMILGYYFTLFYAYKLLETSETNLGKKYLIMLGQFIFYSLIFIIISVVYL